MQAPAIRVRPLHRASRCRDIGDVAPLQRLVEGPRQRILWLAFFVSFAVKVPRVPVHIWLPEAHVEAPTAGSVRLAGVLLKLGTYGLVRFSLPLFPQATAYFTPFVYRLCAVAIVYTSLTAIRQSDRKRVIAYASVAHRNRTLVGLFSRTREGLEGAIFQRLAHGVVSGALFPLRGGALRPAPLPQDRLLRGRGPHQAPLRRRLPAVHQGQHRPAGDGLLRGGVQDPGGHLQGQHPGGLRGRHRQDPGGAYSLWLYNRIAYGNLRNRFHGFSADLTRREARTLLPLALLAIARGIAPQPFLDTRQVSCGNLLEHIRLRR